MSFHRIQVVDSHTGGEPTRVVIAGGPDLGRGCLAEQRHRLATQHDWLRRAVVCEPRGRMLAIRSVTNEHHFQ